MKIEDFLTMFAPQLEEKVSVTMEPRYKLGGIYDDFDSASDKPLPLQAEIVKAIANAFKFMTSLYLVGQMGTGKTYISIWLSHHMRVKRTLVVCPPHLMQQWKEHVKAAYPNMPVKMIPDESDRRAGISDLEALTKIHAAGDIGYVIISREAIKTDLPTRLAFGQGVAAEGKRKTGSVCGKCGTWVPEDVIEKTLDKPDAKLVCGNTECNERLYQQHHPSGTRPSLAKYIKKKMKGFFGLGLVDECHEMKGQDSLQGEVLGKLSGKMPLLAMTGTLMGGMAHDVFHLMFRTNPGSFVKQGYKHSSVQSFVKEYGAQEKIVKKLEEVGKTKIYTKTRPGISPRFIGNFLLDKAVFLRLTDFAESLPKYTEIPVSCKLHPALVKGYETLSSRLVNLKKMETKARSALTHAVLAWPDVHPDEYVTTVRDGVEIEKLVVAGVELPIGATEKEQKLVEIVRAAHADGQKVLIYTNQTRKRDVQPRIAELLLEHGFRTAVMRSDVGTHERLKWITEKAKKLDTLIMHPRLVATGSNILEFPQIVNFDQGMSTFTLRQASMRAMRLSQKAPEVKVHYMYTVGTAQKDCLSLMAKKIEVSLAVEGDLGLNGISAMSYGGDSVLNDLARAINGELTTENPYEVFSRLNKMNNIGKVDKPVRIVVPTNLLPVPSIIEEPAVYGLNTIVCAKEFNARGQALLPF